MGHLTNILFLRYHRFKAVLFHCYELSRDIRHKFYWTKQSRSWIYPFNTSTAYFLITYCSDVSTTSAPEVHEDI
jgi:hypothetical protein